MFSSGVLWLAHRPEHVKCKTDGSCELRTECVGRKGTRNGYVCTCVSGSEDNLEYQSSARLKCGPFFAATFANAVCWGTQGLWLASCLTV